MSDPTKALKSELDAANGKLALAKEFLQDMDSRLAKYESLELEEVLRLLDKYESLGTPEEITQQLLKMEAEGIDLPADIKEKSESCDPDKTDNDPEAVKPKSETTEGDEMSTEDKALLNKYKSLGTTEELETLMTKADEMFDENADMKEKSENLQAELTQKSESLDQYTAIGTVDEIASVITDFDAFKTKAESERIASDLGIDVAHVTKAINKMESVQEAETFLRELFPKQEAEEVDDTEVSDLKTKSESEEVAELVTSDEVLPEHRPKMEASELKNLRAIMNKL